jgi:hypothetical protein
LWLIVVWPVVTVEKPERFVRTLFQAAVEIIKEKPPKATFRFPRLRQFPQASALFLLCLFVRL